MNIYIYTDGFQEKIFKIQIKICGIKKENILKMNMKTLKKLENKNIILNTDDKQKIMLLIKNLKKVKII